MEDIANSKGFKYDAESTKGSAFTPHQKVIDEYTNLTTDLALYEQKELSKMDVQDRLRDWLEGKELERSVIKVKDQEGLDKEFARANEIRDKLQIKRIEFKTPKPRKETSGERPDNSTKGLKQARVKHEARVKNIKSGKATLDGFEKKLLDNGAKPEKVAELSQPIATKENELVRRDEVRSELIEEYNNKKRTELGLPTKKAEKPKQRILATDSTADFSNSVGQNMAILMGDLKIAENVKLTGKSDDFRSKIAERINRELGTNYTKSDIKPLFMQQMYGQMEKGLLKQVKGDKALFDGYERAMKEDYPAFYELSDALMKLADNNPKGEFKYNLPDGTEVSFSLKGKDSVKQKTGQTIEFGTGEYDKYSRALAPNIMHSIDGYIIREIGNRLGDMEIDSRAIHDALTFRTEHSDLVFRTALDVQKDLLKSNTLHDIMTQLGYKGEPLKKNTLTEDHLEKSLGKSMDFEHFANKYEEHDTPRDMTNDRLLEEDDLIREYFARNNVKLSGVNQLTDHMVTEAGFNTLKYSNARTTDDVYERAMVEALTGRKQPRIKVPEGKHFDRIQEEIFTEARAKAEKNPMLVGYLEGKRKFFDEKGNSLLSNNKTIQQIETEQMRQYRKQLKGMTTREIKQVTKLVKQKIRVKRLNKETVIAPDFKALSKQVKSWKPAKELTTSEAKAHNLVMKTELGERPRTSDYMTTWNEQLSSSPVYKEFNTLEVMRNVFRSESSRKAEIIANRVKKIPKKQQKDISVLLNSDYEAIRGMTKEKADSIWKNAGSLRRLIWKEINDGARALTSKSEQYGAYLNNATLIAERYNLDKSAIKLIDQLISIKAMKDNNGWEALNRLDNSKDMNYVLDVMANNRMISERSLFQNNPEKMVKGFKSEVYKGNKFIDDDGKVKYDAEQKYEEGVIGSERENKKVGTQFEGDLPEQLLEKRMEDLQGLSQKEMKAVKQIFNITNDRRTKAQSKYIEDLWKKGSKHLGRFKTLDEELKFMQDNRLKKTNGKYRQVAGDKIRYEAGKIDDLSEIIAETVRSTSEKLHEQGIIAKVLDELEGGKSNLFSKEPKANFVEMTKEQKAMIPFHLREDFNYINPQFIDKLLGRKEVRLFANDESSQAVKIADRLLNNLGVMFKQNVVLKNPTSYLNAMLVNQTLGMAQKANPIKYAKYQKEAIRDLKEMKELVRRQTLRTSAGKKPDPRITKKLENNILYKMERAGLSTNKVEGVLGDNDLLGSMLEDKLGKLSVPFKYLNLNQKTIGGKVSLEAFSAIDTMGRYAMTKQLMSKGKSMEEAVREANNLFGNMDKMVPPLIEKLDKYGIVPFAKWFSLTSPQLLKLSKDNPVTALALGISLFILGQETDRNLSSVNPLEAMIDFAEDSAYLGTKEKLEEKGFLDTLQNRAGSNVIPKYMVNAYKHPETLGLEKLMKNRVHYRPFKGFVQDTVEGDEK
ncbi:MAG: hypothetical protein K0U20_09455 [Proteobacteria bacterium]|nr:hypothetical protein [Pseudomonadota bacterium]